MSNPTYLDIAPRLGKVRNKVYRVGVELEGGWKELPSGAKLTHDGSVMFSGVRADGVPNPYWSPEQRASWDRQRREAEVNGVPTSVGELPSSPLPPKEVAGWIRKFYPPFVNETCGLHVHMSFGSRTAAYQYMLLMDKRYQPTILEFLSRWAVTTKAFSMSHPLIKRLAGGNSYCKTTPPNADAQAKPTQKGGAGRVPGYDRYTAINYCYGIHQTIECRVLPMFDDAETAIEAIQLVQDITSAFLVMIAERPKRLDIPILVEEDAHREEFREIV